MIRENFLQYFEEALREIPNLPADAADSAKKIPCFDAMVTDLHAGAACKQPPLFYQSPETAGNHIRLAIRLAQRGLLGPNITSPAQAIVYMLTNPAKLCLSNDDLILRLVWGRLAKQTTNTLTPTRQEVEVDLMHRLGHADARLPIPSLADKGLTPEERQRIKKLRVLAGGNATGFCVLKSVTLAP